MKKKVLVIGGFVAATLLVGGWALAQSAGHGPGGMRGMGMGMHGQMGQGMRSQMGSGMMGMGAGMMGMSGGSATMDERRDIHGLLFNHDRIKRTVTNLPDGIRTVTESDDPEKARRCIRFFGTRTRSRPRMRRPTRESSSSRPRPTRLPSRPFKIMPQR